MNNSDETNYPEKLEELVYWWLVNNKELAGVLTKYNGAPAIFYQVAPTDVQGNWEDGVQYPRIVYTIDMQADQERKSAGAIKMDVLCDESGRPPEEIEPLVKESMKNLILNPANSSPYGFAWFRSDAYEISERTKGADTRIDGVEIRFDILEFTDQITTEPDPVQAVNLFLKEQFNEAFVLGQDEIGLYRIATEDSPIFYARISDYETDHATYALVWVNAKVVIHVIAPDSNARAKWVRQIHGELARRSRVTMTDGSPMLIKKLRVDNQADYLSRGQIAMDMYYSMLSDRVCRTGADPLGRVSVAQR